MYLQVEYDHPIVCNGSAKTPTTLKDQRYFLSRQLRMTTIKNESHDTKSQRRLLFSRFCNPCMFVCVEIARKV